MPLIYVLAEMEYTGVTLDTVALKQSSEELTTALKKLEKEIYELAGMKFNINCPPGRRSPFRSPQDRRESEEDQRQAAIARVKKY